MLVGRGRCRGRGIGPIGWLSSPVNCCRPKFNFMPRDTKTKAGSSNSRSDIRQTYRQFTVRSSQLVVPRFQFPAPCSRFSFACSSGPVTNSKPLAVGAAGLTTSSTWHSQMCALRSKEFQISHFCLTIGTGRQIKIIRAKALPSKRMKMTEDGSLGGTDTVGDNLKSSAGIEQK